MSQNAYQTKVRLFAAVSTVTLCFCTAVGIAVLNGDMSWVTLWWKRAVLGMVSVTQILAISWRMKIFQTVGIKGLSRLKDDIDDLEKELSEISRQIDLARQTGDNEKANALSETSVIGLSRLDQILKELEREAGQQSRQTILIISSQLGKALRGFSGIPLLLDFVGYLFPRKFRQYEWQLSVTDFKLDYSEARERYRSLLIRAVLVALFAYKGVKLVISAQRVLWWSRMTKALESVVRIFRK